MLTAKWKGYSNHTFEGSETNGLSFLLEKPQIHTYMLNWLPIKQIKKVGSHPSIILCM